MSDLARQLAAHPRWRWMPGMLALDSSLSLRVARACGDLIEGTLDNPGHVSPGALFVADALPDLSDPATVGCLLAMLREAWTGDEPGGTARFGLRDGGFVTFDGQGVDCLARRNTGMSGPFTEKHRGPMGEALALALLAAWGEP